jgi:hypothetical protein
MVMAVSEVSRGSPGFRSIGRRAFGTPRSVSAGQAADRVSSGPGDGPATASMSSAGVLGARTGGCVGPHERARALVRLRVGLREHNRAFQLRISSPRPAS